MLVADVADPLSRTPMTGIAGFWALAESGQAAAAPPTSVMNLRRSIAGHAPDALKPSVGDFAAQVSRHSSKTALGNVAG
jgi:hypothetical protein